uniref:CSD domain-containing protein n=1 Tax=Noctiluca scintillans TaxID=2966 RepID=A0A7S0ZPV5_NOCSC|mmetsp:Transcript_13782/g.37735  ORF Transcript_13782/g.37735 Transcript_13782/m.37735 type:complete len:429 (+) Transcript_13782:97-1383(+)|eukprot:CAMPEP_0194520890 /NCGR_PEP_ID=MMETSP0253-20130528/55033_1 /TAXON_ID=2966 /ORGANISM="Noctiluca scintillans" /LENGTH=428 /DNA_ID=CAMNT_0039365185 /DNA_START=17 /DNA_END=1303 /DNA_ORIENTATION=+
MSAAVGMAVSSGADPHGTAATAAAVATAHGHDGASNGELAATQANEAHIQALQAQSQAGEAQAAPGWGQAAQAAQVSWTQQTQAAQVAQSWPPDVAQSWGGQLPLGLDQSAWNRQDAVWSPLPQGASGQWCQPTAAQFAQGAQGWSAQDASSSWAGYQPAQASQAAQACWSQQAAQAPSPNDQSPWQGLDAWGQVQQAPTAQTWNPASQQWSAPAQAAWGQPAETAPCQSWGQPSPARTTQSHFPGGQAIPGISENRYEGVVISVLREKGFGFIRCPDLKAAFPNNDVFLHRNQMGNLKQGDAVSFQCFFNRSNKPQATEIQQIPMPPELSVLLAESQTRSAPGQFHQEAATPLEGPPQEVEIPDDVVQAVLGEADAFLEEVKRQAGDVHVEVRGNSKGRLLRIHGPAVNTTLAACILLHRIDELTCL